MDLFSFKQIILWFDGTFKHVVINGSMRTYTNAPTADAKLACEVFFRLNRMVLHFMPILFQRVFDSFLQLIQLKIKKKTYMKL